MVLDRVFNRFPFAAPATCLIISIIYNANQLSRGYFRSLGKKWNIDLSSCFSFCVQENMTTLLALLQQLISALYILRRVKQEQLSPSEHCSKAFFSWNHTLGSCYLQPLFVIPFDPYFFLYQNLCSTHVILHGCILPFHVYLIDTAGRQTLHATDQYYVKRALQQTCGSVKPFRNGQEIKQAPFRAFSVQEKKSPTLNFE